MAGQQRIVRDQIASRKTDVFTGKEFGAEEEESDNGLKFEDMISIDEELLKEAFGGGIDTTTVTSAVQEHMSTISMSINADIRPAQEALSETLRVLSNDMLTDYISKNADPETGIALLRPEDSDYIAASYLATDEAQAMLQTLAEDYILPADVYYTVYRPLLGGLLELYAGTIVELTAVPGDEEGADTPSLPSREELEELVGIQLPEFDFPLEPNMTAAPITTQVVEPLTTLYTSLPMVTAGLAEMSIAMTETVMQTEIMTEVSPFMAWRS